MNRFEELQCLCNLGASFGVQVLHDGQHYVVTRGALVSRWETMVMAAAQVGALYVLHSEAAEREAAHEARRAIAAARFGLRDMDAHDRRIAAAAKGARRVRRSTP